MMKISTRKTLVGIALAAGSLVCAAPASAQPARTWVSGVGDDMDPCSRTAPCKTFAGALAKTAAGGEINCLDPGAYGPVTITKSISIVCQYTEAGVLATHGATGIVINAGVNDIVFLSGLDLNGGGTAFNAGADGIRILAAGEVHIQDSIIRNFTSYHSQGIRIAPGNATQVTVSDTVVAGNGATLTGGGILIQPTGAAGSARVTLRNLRIHNNVNNQILVDTTGNSGAGISLFVENSQILGGTNGIRINQAPATTNVTTVVQDSLIALGSGTGIVTAGTNTNRMRVGNTTITAWPTGLTQGGTTVINTYGTNRFDGNGAVGTFTLPPIGQQ